MKFGENLEGKLHQIRNPEIVLQEVKGISGRRKSKTFFCLTDGTWKEGGHQQSITGRDFRMGVRFMHGLHRYKNSCMGQVFVNCYYLQHRNWEETGFSNF